MFDKIKTVLGKIGSVWVGFNTTYHLKDMPRYCSKCGGFLILGSIMFNYDPLNGRPYATMINLWCKGYDECSQRGYPIKFDPTSYGERKEYNWYVRTEDEAFNHIAKRLHGSIYSVEEKEEWHRR